VSRRKLTATSLEQGFNRQNHWWKTVRYCPECHVHGSKPHLKECKSKKWVEISQDAQIPRKNSRKKIWEWFNRKFVDKEFRKYNNEQFR
jgi:hypothetical protein